MTSQTQQAFLQTLAGLIALTTDLLLIHGFPYVLLGQFQSDKLEGEFGVYRQSSGGCYFISVEQLLCSARFRRMQLYSRLCELDASSHVPASCCATCLSDDEVAFLDYCPEAADNLSPEENASIYYVCGYIAKKVGLASSRSTSPESNFTELVSRGLLTYPPKWLFVFGQLSYSFFVSSGIRCVTRLSQAFVLVYETFFDMTIDYPTLSSICRRLSNCVLKGFVRRDSETPASCTNTKRKLRKLQS